MCNNYIVCFSFNKEYCEEDTKEIAKRNNAIDWFVDPVFTPITNQLAYRGTIVKEMV